MDTAELVVFGRFISVLILCFGFECATSARDLALHKTATQSSTYSIYGASRAVDGTPGRDVVDGHCSHSGTGHNQAWWMVDLGQVYRIQTINIINRHDYTYRLSGYYLYVTNDTHMTQSDGGIDENVGYLCYHDHGPRYPSYNQSRTCPVKGRYVIIYNKRPADFTPSEHSGYYSSTEALIELCEVQVFGCPVGRFGDGCSFTCHCAEGGCDSDTGQCDVAGCQTGWNGPNCYVPLSDVAYGGTASQSSVNINGIRDANKAVDGNPGEDSCSHTYPNAWKKAWWMVDLGHEQMINTVNIVFSHQHKFTISGYYLYVSTSPIVLDNTTTLQTAHLCYHDTTTTSDGPPTYRQSHQCSVTGQYVIVYNNRSSSLVDSTSHYSPEDAVVELCDVQVLKCPSGYFGPDCTTECHCKTGQCDVVNGTCNIRGCQDGWEGDACNQECSSGHFGPGCSKICHCQRDGCNHIIGTCNHAGCQAGWRGQACDQKCVAPTFGRDCNQTCHCANSGCDSMTGTCTLPGCTEGWTGDACSQECSSGHFGPGCSKVCHCQQTGCDHIHGKCDHAGCQTGWSGLACDHQCVSPSFGRDCNQTCHCASSGCDSMSGTCNIPGCTEGWTTATCSQECDSHRFGRDCNQTCHCAKSGCDRMTGTCTLPGCTEGWTGDACSQECSSGHFGPGCSKISNCQRDGCNHISGTCNRAGCQAGWRGQACDQKCVAPTFGRDCNETCHCAIFGCDSMTGSCTLPGCTEGWIGEACSQECSSGHFGPGCSKVCHCQQTGCDHIHGKCDHAGCQAGWSGLACDHQCVSPSFGRDCNQTCHCANSGCDRMTGTCTLPGCTEGWTTATCSQECDSHRFGRNCNQTCNCANSGCDRITGTCTLPGCTEGWIGKSCSQECGSNIFGRDCNQTCHCASSSCDRMNGTCFILGCTKGWTGHSCSHAEKHISSQSDGSRGNATSSSADSSSSTGYALFGTFLAISVILNIGLSVYFLRVRFRNVRTTESPPKELQTYYIPNHESSYEDLDSTKIDTTRNIYDTIIK